MLTCRKWHAASEGNHGATPRRRCALSHCAYNPLSTFTSVCQHVENGMQPQKENCGATLRRRCALSYSLLQLLQGIAHRLVGNCMQSQNESLPVLLGGVHSPVLIILKLLCAGVSQPTCSLTIKVLPHEPNISCYNIEIYHVAKYSYKLIRNKG